MSYRNPKLIEATHFGYAPCNNWKCPGCFVVLTTAQSARRHIKTPCARFAEVIVKARANITAQKSTAVTTLSQPPLYSFIDLNKLKSDIEKLCCPHCQSPVHLDTGQKNSPAFTMRYHCVKCPFEFASKSSPLVKSPSRSHSQPDIQLRLPAVAQTVGLKYAQMSRFLYLLGINPPAKTSWQRASDLVFDSVEKITLKSMQKAQEVAKNDTDLWVIIDCRWASRGYNSEQATVLIIDGKQDKVLIPMMSKTQLLPI